MILAGTGHRPDKLGGYDRLNAVYPVILDLTLRALEFLKPDLVLSGMALGFDQMLAEICVIREIPFKAYVPFPGFSNPWPDHSKRHYEHLLSCAQEVVMVSDETEYSPRLLHARNCRMVNDCDLVLACYNGSSGGTASTISYAQRRGKSITYLNVPPETWVEANRIAGAIAARRALRRQDQMRVSTTMPPSFPPPDPAPLPLPQAVKAAAPHHSQKDMSFQVGRKIILDDHDE